MRVVSCEAGKDSTSGAICKVPPLDVDVLKSPREFETECELVRMLAMRWNEMSCEVNDGSRSGKTVAGGGGRGGA